MHRTRSPAGRQALHAIGQERAEHLVRYGSRAALSHFFTCTSTHRLLMDTLAKLRAGQLVGLKRLDLSCGLTEFPPEIFQLADTLEILNLERKRPQPLARGPAPPEPSAHSVLPGQPVHRTARLPWAMRETEHDRFQGQPNRARPGAALPPLLRWLILTDNRIQQLPDELGRRPLLAKVDVGRQPPANVTGQPGPVRASGADPSGSQPVHRTA